MERRSLTGGGKMSFEETPQAMSTAKDESLQEKNDERDCSKHDVIVSEDSDISPTVTVIMPTLNEKAGVRECIESVKASINSEGLLGEIIVSDSSDDRTPEIARAAGARVVTPDKPGYGYAYRYAFEYARGNYIVIGDADTTYDFEELPKLLALVRDGDADMALGSRLEGDIEEGAMPALHQHIGNPLLTRFLNLFYGAGVSDAHSGFRVIRRDVLEDLQLSATGMEFASEMIMEASASGYSIAEEPITYSRRKGDATLESFRDGWRHVKFMLVNAPDYLFSGPGLILTVIGLSIMALSSGNIELGSLSFGSRSMIAGSLLTIAGAEVLSLGIFATIASDPVRNPTDLVTNWITSHMTFARGTTFGLLVFTIGAILASSLIINWVSTGYQMLPPLRSSILAFTAIILGIQIVFSSFFMSAILPE